MSGLIWAGIGKGIADAGQSFGSAAMRQIEMDRQDERDALREERLLKRQEALDELRAARERTREEELQQRVIKESAAVGPRADVIGATREGRAFDNLAQSSAAAGEQGDVSLSKEQLQKLVKDNPALGEQYKRMGLIDSSMPLTASQKRLQRADDEVQASLDIGAHSSVQKSLLEKRKAVLEEIREENREKRNEQRHVETMAAITERGRQFDEKKPILQQNADANTTRANKPPSKGGSGSVDTTNIRTLQDFTARERTLRTQVSKAFGAEKTKLQGELDELLVKRRDFEARAQSGGGANNPKPGDNSGARPPLSSFVR